MAVLTHGLLGSAAVQARVVWALLLREMLTRYGRHNIGFLWLFVEPALFTLAIAWLWSLVRAHATDLPIIEFAVTGYATVLLWRNAASRCTKAVETNWALLYHRNVTALDVFLARIALEVAGASLAFAVLALVLVLVGVMHWPQDALRVLLAWLLLIWFAVGFALIVGALSERSNTFERMWHVIAYILFPLSGAVYMANWLPDQAREVVLVLPMVHGVEMLRHGWFGDVVNTHESLSYLVFANLVVSLLGFSFARDLGRRVEPQ